MSGTVECVVEREFGGWDRKFDDQCHAEARIVVTKEIRVAPVGRV